MNDLNIKQFYKELGHLYYAIADADGKVQLIEKETLQNFIIKELLPLEKTVDSSGMNHSFYTEFEFDELNENHSAPDLIFLKFIDYIKSVSSLLSDEHKKIIISGARKVADAFNKTNKRELQLIDNLEYVLTNLN